MDKGIKSDGINEFINEAFFIRFSGAKLNEK